MTKDDYILLIMKGVGLYLLAQALLAAPDLLTGAYAYKTIMTSSLFSGAEVGDMRRETGKFYQTMLIAPVMKTVLYSAVGVYLIRGGKFIFRLLRGES